MITLKGQLLRQAEKKIEKGILLVMEREREGGGMIGMKHASTSLQASSDII